MLKKEEIFVDIQSKREHDKVKKLLKSFDQEFTIKGWDRYERCAHFYNNYWCVPERSYIEKFKTEVSIQELKNILAFEYLKKGDVIIFSGGISGFLWIAEFEHFTSNRRIGLPLSIKSKRYNSLHKESRYQHSTSGEIYGSFVRFATDGEKRALGVKIDPDSELCEIKVGFYRNFHNEVKINEEWPIKPQVFKKDQIIESLNDAYKSMADSCTLETMFVRNALFIAMDYITAIPDITTHDVAKIERLHDYLIDAYNIHPSFKQLEEAREVISKLSKYTNHE